MTSQFGITVWNQSLDLSIFILFQGFLILFILAHSVHQLAHGRRMTDGKTADEPFVAHGRAAFHQRRASHLAWVALAQQPKLARTLRQAQRPTDNTDDALRFAFVMSPDGGSGGAAFISNSRPGLVHEI